MGWYKLTSKEANKKITFPLSFNSNFRFKDFQLTNFLNDFLTVAQNLLHSGEIPQQPYSVMGIIFLNEERFTKKLPPTFNPLSFYPNSESLINGSSSIDFFIA